MTGNAEHTWPVDSEIAFSPNVLFGTSCVNRYGHLVDLYAWNPHCRYLDGKGPSGTQRIISIHCYSVFLSLTP